jgi:beta-lactamase regulating signal transducer with metallopeptidase domain
MSDLFSLSIALIIVVSIIGTLIYVFKPSELSSNNESKSKPTANNSIDSLQKIIEKQNDLINKHIKNNNKPNTSQVIMYDYVVYGVTGLSVLLAISGLYVAQRSRKKVKELEENYSKKEGITDNEKEKIVEQTAIKVVSTLNN